MPRSSFTIEIRGIDELVAAYQAGEAIGDALLREAMQRSLNLVREDAKIYPPESEANFPPPPYYVRGVGTVWRGGKNRGESQQLREKWQTSIDTTGHNTFTGKVFNQVIYAPWVHGISQQVAFHRARGWRTVRDIAVENTQKVEAFFSQAAQKLVAFLNRSGTSR